MLQLSVVTVGRSYSCLWLQLAEVTANKLHLSANHFSQILRIFLRTYWFSVAFICIYVRFSHNNRISGAQFAASKNFRGPIWRDKISKGPNLPPRGPICRGPICRGPICRQGAQSAGARFAKKWQIGPQKVRGPICRQIGEGPNLPGPNLSGPNLPQKLLGAQFARGPICLEPYYLKYTWQAPATEGIHYFICGIPGHCPSMRVAIEVSNTCWKVQISSTFNSSLVAGHHWYYLKYTWQAPATEGTHYFICGIPGHCPSMRVAIEVSNTCWKAQISSTFKITDKICDKVK